MTDDLFRSPAIAEGIEAIRREIGFRRRVYPRQVALGKMSQAEADKQIRLMQTVIDALELTELRQKVIDEAREVLQFAELFGIDPEIEQRLRAAIEALDRYERTIQSRLKDGK